MVGSLAQRAGGFKPTGKRGNREQKTKQDQPYHMPDPIGARGTVTSQARARSLMKPSDWVFWKRRNWGSPRFAKVFDKLELFADQHHLRRPAAIARELGSVIGAPSVEAAIFAFGQGKIAIHIAKLAQADIGGADQQLRHASPIQRYIVTSRFRHGLLPGFEIT